MGTRMHPLFLILLIIGFVCFLLAAVGGPYRASPPERPAFFARVDLIALGLLFWILVPLIEQFKIVVH
jgi:hypothetical protein